MTTETSLADLFPPDDVNDVVRSKIDNSITAVVHKMGGDAAFVERPSKAPGSQFALKYPNVRHAIRAAVMLRDAANGRIRRYVDEARGEGLSWATVGELLGLAEENGVGADERAYELVATGDQFDRTTSWRCQSCDEFVIDRGPYNSHPVDCEKGHAEGCQRFAAAIAAWRERTRWDED